MVTMLILQNRQFHGLENNDLIIAELEFGIKLIEMN